MHSCWRVLSVFLLSLQTLELDSLLLGFERRLPQLLEDVSILEREDDGQLHAVLSLHVIENELMDIKQLINKLNSTTLGYQRLTTDTTEQVKSTQNDKHQLFNTNIIQEGSVCVQAHF